MLKTPDVCWSKRISCQLTLTSDMTFRRHDAQHRHPNWNEYSRKKKTVLPAICVLYTQSYLNNYLLLLLKRNLSCNTLFLIS